MSDDSFYLLFNAHDQPLDFVLPDGNWRATWRETIRSGIGFVGDEQLRRAADHVSVDGRELVVLQLVDSLD